MSLSFDDEESFKEAAGSLRFNNLLSDTDTSTPTVLQRLGVGSSSSMPLQESLRTEDICFNNPRTDPNTKIRQLGVGSSSMLPQERTEVA